MNDLMSMGLHRPWKSRFVSLLNPGRLPGSPHAQQILDVAGGTGDISYRILEHMTDINRDVESKVLCTDINPDMLREGERRLQTDPSLARWKDRIEFRVENAETLESIPDNSIDIYTVSFGIRNVTDIPKALRTAHRVLKSGGVLGVLEFSRVKPWILDEIYQRYSFSVIPVMGQIVAGDRDSYQYLVESIRMFPSQARFAEMIEEAGFELPVGKPYEELTFGVANIWRGIKL
jgi:2-methoxy-6-polyprenyl-1,4-benzoquinol methylase